MGTSGRVNPTCNQTYPTPAYVGLFQTQGDISTSAHDPTFECKTDVEDDTYVSPGFLLSSAFPASITVQASAQPTTTGSGTPTLYVYDRNGNVDVSLSASSFNSTTATFAASSLKSLAPDMYSVAMTNSGSASGTNYLGNGWFALGRDNQTYPGAFGVDAIHYTAFGNICTAGSGPRSQRCTTVNTTLNYPIVTLYQQGKVSFNGTGIAVGTNPTVVYAYKNGSTFRTDPYGGSVRYTEPQNALVVNTGSNSVSILNLPSAATVATIPVGNQPVDARISADNSTAYVVNYGSGTVSKISLSSYAVVATGAVGSKPTAIDLDANGNLIVGGAGYIVTLDPNTVSVTATQPVAGSVSALGISAAKNQVVTSMISGTGTAQTTVVGANTFPGYSPNFTSQSMSTLPLTHSSTTSSLPFASQLAHGIIVSPVLNNSFAAEATPTGFLITDLETNQILLSGNTPYPVRGMAVDTTNGYFYFTMPDSNSVVTVPIPTTPVSNLLQLLN